MSERCHEHNVPDCRNEWCLHIAVLEQQNTTMREALQPFARFFDMWSARPLRGIDDEFYCIHTGTEWEASIRISDMQKALEALEKVKA